MVEIDSETLFNAAAAVAGALAVLFFLFNVELGYSPVSEFAVVVAFLAGIFAVAQRTTETQPRLLGYGVVVVGSLGLLFDLVGTFELGELALVVGLLAVAAALYALRGRLAEDGTLVAPDRATVGVGAAVAVAVLVVLVDVGTGGVAYELRLDDEVTVTDEQPETVQIGTVVVENPTPLPERVETPRYGACTAGNWSSAVRPVEDAERRGDVEADVHVQNSYGDHVPGFGRRSYAVQFHAERRVRAGTTVPIRRTEACPDDATGPPYLAVFERRDTTRAVPV